MADNRNKAPVDESILEETPPNINQPQNEEHEDEHKGEDKEPAKEVESEKETPEETTVVKPEQEEVKDKPQETSEQKEQRYKAQQTEAQIQAAKNRDLINKVDEATKVGDPTTEELKAFVRVDGVDWDELTTFEQSMAKKSYLSEKRFDLVNQAVQSTKKIDEWATSVDTFIDSTDAKPEFLKLSGHEADFRKFCMKESHRGSDIEALLLPAFLHNLPVSTKKRGSLFETAGGGEKNETPGKITDADTASTLRATNPREYKRLVKSGAISLDV